MLPSDGEFLLLYGCWFMMLMILIIGYIAGRNKKFFRNNMILFSVYTGIMIILFANENNFKYGSSLMVLFIGAVFILSHFAFLLIFFIISVAASAKKR